MAWRWVIGIAVATALAGTALGGAALAHEGMHRPANMTPAQKRAFDRHDNFEKLGKLFGAIGAEIRKDEPDAAVLKTQAAEINKLANGLPTWFPKGSGVEARSESMARPEIWTDTAGFKEVATHLRDEAGKLDQLAKAGDIPGMKAQFGNLAGTCKGCHDKYRAKKS